MAHPELTKAIEVVGLQPLANALGVSYQAIRKWEAQGRLPRTEWTGETCYVEKIVALAGGTIDRTRLLRADKSEEQERAAGAAKSGEVA